MYELTNKFATALLIILGAVILTKHGYKIYLSLTGKTKESDGHKQLDKLIRQNELKFQGVQRPQPLQGNIQSTGQKEKWKASLTSAYETASDKDEKATADRFLLYLKEMEWGEGQLLNGLARTINQVLPLPLGNAQIKSFVEFVIHSGCLFPFKGSDRLIKSSLLDPYLVSLSFIYNVKSLITSNKVTAYSKLYNISSRNFENTLLHFLLLVSGDEFSSSLKSIFHNKKETSKKISQLQTSQYLPFLFDANKKPHDPSLLIKKWQMSLNIWVSLSPLEILPGKEEQCIYSITKTTKNSSWEDIKKSYNREIKVRHPDHYSSYNLPAEYEKIITENFQKLQSAFQKMKSEKKS